MVKRNMKKELKWNTKKHPSHHQIERQTGRYTHSSHSLARLPLAVQPHYIISEQEQKRVSQFISTLTDGRNPRCGAETEDQNRTELNINSFPFSLLISFYAVSSPSSRAQVHAISERAQRTLYTPQRKNQ